jgi:hypothetical protein
VNEAYKKSKDKKIHVLIMYVFNQPPVEKPPETQKKPPG